MKGYPLSADHVVHEVGKLNPAGNLIPHSWYKHIRMEGTGKSDLVAITILGEIVYWYRPIQGKDPQCGKMIAAMKKFKADRLQRSYGSFADQFRISKYQLKRATDNLVRLGLNEKTFKIVPLENGGVLGNVL